jgi:ribosomal-protein-alanine N-acetyltransferase
MAIVDLEHKQSDTNYHDPRILIERMQESDLGEVLKIEQVSFSMPWTRIMFETELRETTLSYPIVARWLGEPTKENISPEGDPSVYPICGYSVFWHVLDEIHIGNLAVAPAYQRHGVASALIKNILNLGQQWKVVRVSLEVRQSNEAAIRLYLRFGFKEVAIRRKYYTQPIEDAIVMVKDDNVQPT